MRGALRERGHVPLRTWEAWGRPVVEHLVWRTCLSSSRAGSSSARTATRCTGMTRCPRVCPPPRARGPPLPLPVFSLLISSAPPAQQGKGALQSSVNHAWCCWWCRSCLPLDCGAGLQEPAVDNEDDEELEPADYHPRHAQRARPVTLGPWTRQAFNKREVYEQVQRQGLAVQPIESYKPSACRRGPVVKPRASTCHWDGAPIPVHALGRVCVCVLLVLSASARSVRHAQATELPRWVLPGQPNRAPPLPPHSGLLLKAFASSDIFPPPATRRRPEGSECADKHARAFSKWWSSALCSPCARFGLCRADHGLLWHHLRQGEAWLSRQPPPLEGQGAGCPAM